MTSTKIISVDFQKEFSAKGGKHYRPHPNVDFIKKTLVPFLRKHNIKVAEIISDYRQPRPGDLDDSTCPGEDGYISEIPEDVKLKNVWVKCMNSPIWTRKNIGDPNKKPGLPYQDPEAFTKWLNSTIGKPEEVDEVILIGLTIDCCVLCTAQELKWRGYRVKILKEAVDTYSGNQKETKMILSNPPLLNWAKVISWNELKKLFKLI
ncbi:MAG: cysteine hydrolase family protein [Patescibacteria group bacterium]|nr:cysteine hydrolase family protein [Patescibacteria group bacterium]MBU2508867.1 cysteine hydrolase family protein [Patescibacteria group bacterium]